MKEKNAIHRRLCEAAVLIIVFSSIIFFTACSDNRDITDRLLNEVQAENEDLSALVIKLEGEIVKRDELIDELQNRIERNNDEVSDDLLFYEKEQTHYHGYVRAKQPAEKPDELQSGEIPVELRVLPSDTSALLDEVYRMRVISEVHTFSNEDWLLVESAGRSKFGYVRSNEVEMYERGAANFSESTIAISGIKLGSPYTMAIELLGNEYIHFNAHRSRIVEGIFYDGIDFFYEPVSLKIEEIIVRDEKLKIEGLFGIGDNIEIAKAYFGDGYVTEIAEDKGVFEFIVWPPDGYRLIISYKDGVIRAIRYTIHSSDIG